MKMNTIQKLILIGILGFFSSNYLFAEKLKTSTHGGGGKPKSGKDITAGCAPGSGATYIELNNVRALIFTGGDMWWDLQNKAKYEVPKNSGKTALFAGSIWIGGEDVNGQIKLAAMRYRQGIDYWPGPLITSGEQQASVTPEICQLYDHHFVIKKDEVLRFRSWYNADAATRAKDFQGYSIPGIIQDWPAHGPGGGYDNYLAPFFDNNGDGSYSTSDGDYPFFDLDNTLPCGTTRDLRKPRLYGDQSLWWVYNDRGNLHTETGGDAIGFEIRAQAFAFATNDELNNMTFYNYALINRSTYTLKETYFGIWTDADMGFADDDYVGCDVNRGLGYLYNGKAIDGTGQAWAYGGPNPPPPAIGIDFFEGPYQDADGEDNLSSWDNLRNLSCTKGYQLNRTTGVMEEKGSGDILNGNINGLNYGDSIVDNERWGMRRFIYFNNCNTNDICDPQTAVQYYQYLRGYWKDGTRLTFGGTGHVSSLIYTDFMFPGITDPCNWGTSGNPPPSVPTPNLGWCEKGETPANPPGDRRLVQSAGPFTLEPGAVNDITTGAVWARATSGDEYESVKQVQQADDKAQKLFENCFKVLDGPDAPELNIVEMANKLIFHIWNKPVSNNYLEKYYQKDPFIVCPVSKPLCDKYYEFQGYQVFQLANQFASVAELHDPAKARIVFQCDIKDSVADLVNFTWSDDFQANVPVREVVAANKGIQHSFVLNEDAFATGSKKLVNNKKYYYVAIAYGFNDFLHYDQTDGATVSGQKFPYKASRKGADGAIKVYEVIPHINSPENGGTIYNSDYGDGVSITQVEGHGNGSNNLDLADETITEIMSGAPWKAKHPVYKEGMGPIKVKIIDPLSVPSDNYTIKMDSAELHTNIGTAQYYKLNLIKKAKWSITNSAGTKIWSDQWIYINDEMLILDWGISVNLQQVMYPLVKSTTPVEGYFSTKNVLGPINNNNLIEATISNSDEKKEWLYFLQDVDGIGAPESVKPENFIRSGTFKDPDNAKNDDYGFGDPVTFWDPEQVYEKLIGGTWTPYFLASRFEWGPGFSESMTSNYLGVTNGPGPIRTGLSSVDVVITPDKSKWSRCPVIEMCDDPLKSEGGANKFDLRKSASKDRNGSTGTAEATANGTQPYGMSYFPGYAIDVETGERLNMMFGEDSWLSSSDANGKDMLWNPTSSVYTDLFLQTGGSAGEVLFGGKHYIYVMNRPNYFRQPPATGVDTLSNYDESYDIYTWMKPDSLGVTNPARKRVIMALPMWCAIPLLRPGTSLENGNTPLSEIKIRLRIEKPYRKGYNNWAVDAASAQNNNLPMYTFSTVANRTVTGDNGIAKSALDLIGIVPNPYYGYNSYEATQTETLVKIVNLPKKCTITIFSVNGTLIRKFSKDNESTIVEWDLKNNYDISISSGLYIVHIDAPGIGEKIVKWFGALRPIDMNSF